MDSDFDPFAGFPPLPPQPPPAGGRSSASWTEVSQQQQQEESPHAVQGMSAALREWCASELRRLGHAEALPLAEYCHGLPGAEEARELFRDNLGRGRPAVDAFVEAFLVRRTFAHSVSEDLLLLMLPDEEECRDQSERSPWGSAVGGRTTKVVDPFDIFISPCNGQGSNDCVSDVVSCSAPTDASTRNTWQQGPAVEAGAWDPFSSIDAPAADDPFAGFSVPSAQPVCQGAVRTAVQPAPQQPRHSPAHVASVKGTAGGNKGECVVCMARDVNATFVHVESGMGHSACCLQCAQALLSSGAPCPMCRMPITMVIRNYSS